MNGPNPPPPSTLDELLSADIDGELERAAADHGLPLDAARAAIATPEAVVRRAALTQARDLVAAPVPLDPADADRLAAGALDRARHENELAAARRRRNRFDAARRVAIAAAAIVVVFGGIAVLARGTTSSKSSGSNASSAGSASRSIAAPTSPAAELGDVSTSRALRAKVLPRLPKHGTDRPTPQSTSGSPQIEVNSNAKGASAFDRAGPKGPRGLVVPQSRATEPATSPVRPSRVDCVEALVRSGRVPPAPVFSGTGTAGGRPVYVAAFRNRSGYAVYVLRATDCAVLRRTVV